MPIVAAFAWGFAEATLFFIVADVFLSLLVVWRGFRVAFFAALAAALGAVPGGVLMLFWSANDPAGLLSVLERLPSIDAAMIANAGEALAGNWFGAILAGAFSGLPYKVFAAQVWPAGISTLAFLLATVPLRLVRYLAVIILLPGLISRCGAGSAVRSVSQFYAAHGSSSTPYSGRLSHPIHDGDASGFQGRGQDLWYYTKVQSGDEGHGAPVAMRGTGFNPLAALCQPCERITFVLTQASSMMTRRVNQSGYRSNAGPVTD